VTAGEVLDAGTTAGSAGSALLEATDEVAALERLHDLGCTDGLPVVIPTPDRVERMALASGLDADLVLGEMGPALGVATIEKVAVAAVMAGCLPDHMPVVVAAVRAVVDPRFDLTEMQATTHNTAPLILVNGPIRGPLGIASGFGALGPGFRANASIGRALRLAMINIGGGRAGESDMALLGHPGKFTYCLGEAEEVSPWEPLHVARGLSAEQSAVTVVGAEAPHSVIAVTDGDDPGSGDRVLDALCAAFSSLATNNAMLRGGAGVVILNPEHAAVLADSGMSRADVASAVCERAGNPRRSLARQVRAFAGSGDPEEFLPCFFSPDDVLVLVAGGGGLYSTVMPTWCAGSHRNTAITTEIETDQACAIPG
jgi:hypothetical protein